MNTQLLLYAAPGSCSKVQLILLEEIGASYEVELLRFKLGAHKTPAYRALNPKGKVPLLVDNGVAITENPVIANYLNDKFPDAKLLPSSDIVSVYQQWSDLCFCSATLHPIVTRIRMPHFFAGLEPAQIVWEKGGESMDEYFTLIDERLQHSQWWYGDHWSAVDAYIYWIFWRVAGANYDTSRFKAYNDHFARMEARPSVQRANAKDAQMQKTLEDEGLAVQPPVFSK